MSLQETAPLRSLEYTQMGKTTLGFGKWTEVPQLQPETTYAAQCMSVAIEKSDEILPTNGDAPILLRLHRQKSLCDVHGWQ